MNDNLASSIVIFVCLALLGAGYLYGHVDTSPLYKEINECNARNDDLHVQVCAAKQCEHGATPQWDNRPRLQHGCVCVYGFEADK